MEVAGQWRREWAGTAEYGKVTEGGVTRQVARAMEVLHASAPGARVRVLRAAYHSTAGPGAPASSYLLHSSRRVISSGYNFIEPDKTPSKPLEISSTPLELSPELGIEKETYKVTEPDDFDISEPSKWRCSKNINSIRMPSEESSSTDNTSVIDLDNNKTAIRKSVDRFTPQSDYKETSPIYSLLDAPVTLRTLKYKSLLNGSDNWNNRRKSYSFEETPQLDDNILRGTDPLTMKSSTDSGICKSTEIVNDNYNSEHPSYVETKIKMNDIHEETFQDWLSKNRQKPYMSQMKINKEHIINVQQINEGNVTLQSAGKVSITLPTSPKTEDYHEIRNSRVNDENDRKTKKVEFCKTELHFAAESGTVNIIATDEKPPPSNDFRKKRSLFVPMNDNYNKSITLFGEKNDVFQVNKNESSLSFISEVNTIDENTAATKSILKNKIPKPKPYLLGENMVFGDSIDLTGKDELKNNFTKPTGVSLINSQFQPEQRSSNKSKLSVGSETDWSSFKNVASRTTEIGSINYIRPHLDAYQTTPKSPEIETDINKTIKSKVKILQMSPTPVRAKTRQLRESDLTYFGVTKAGEIKYEKRKHSLDSAYDENNLKEEILHSVKLVKLISNSVGNSEADSDEAPDYENLPMNYNVAPKPTPRLHSNKSKPLNTILEKQDGETSIFQSRRCKLKKEAVTSTSRSLSAPPKANRQNCTERSSKGHCKPSQSNISSISENKSRTLEKCQKTKMLESQVPESSVSESPIYVNLHTRNTKTNPVEENTYGRRKQLSNQQKKTENKHLVPNNDSRHIKRISNSDKTNDDSNVLVKPKHIERKRSCHRTKILVTPEKSPSKSSETSNKNFNVHKNVYNVSKTVDPSTQKHRSSKTESMADSQGFVTGVKDSYSGREDKQIAKPISDTDIKTKNIPKKIRKSSADVCNSKSQIKEKQDEYTKITTGDVKQSQTKPNKTEKTENIQKNSIRSKYVINYDDQNGTVSSVCKIRSRHGSPRMKNVTNYENKENVRGKTVRKTSSSNKNDTLKLPEERQKSKTRGRQSCQIL